MAHNKKKPKKPAPMNRQRTCFLCNGGGKMCGRCGEAVSVCICEGEEPQEEDCKDCRGTGIASADLPKGG